MTHIPPNPHPEQVEVIDADHDSALDYFEATRGERPTYARDTLLAEMFARHRIASLAKRPADDVTDGTKYADMDTDARAVAMADDCVGDPWELLGFFREKLRQAEVNAESAKSAATRFAIELRDLRGKRPADDGEREQLCETREQLEYAIERMVTLTPSRANAATAHDLHIAIRAIGFSALEQSPGYNERPGLINTDPDFVHHDARYDFAGEPRPTPPQPEGVKRP